MYLHSSKNRSLMQGLLLQTVQMPIQNGRLPIEHERLNTYNVLDGLCHMLYDTRIPGILGKENLFSEDLKHRFYFDASTGILQARKN
jgi:hypothetical protein